MSYYGNVLPAKVAGLPTSKSNPSYSKDTFKMFIPKFADYIDANEGEIETVINTSEDITLTNELTKIVFSNSSNATNTAVLNIDSDNDIVIGKKTILCYREGYNNTSTITVSDTSGSDNEITVTYLLNDVVIITGSISLLANEEKTDTIEFDFSNSEYNSVLTIQIKDSNNSATVTTFNSTVKSNFKAAYGEASSLYEAFFGIADQKIIKTIWNSDWEFGMSLCIAHYLAIVNRETQRSFGLDDIANDSNPRGIKIQDRQGGSLQDGSYKQSALQEKYDFSDIMVSYDESKFWNSTEFGRLMITLLSTKTIATMIVVN